MRALFSVYDKRDLLPFAERLHDLGVEIVATSGTARFLKENGVECVEVGELTGFPEILGGRVKTLHPLIFGAILGKPEDPSHLKELKRLGIEPFDMIVVILNPFEEISDVTRREETLIDRIDVGGAALLIASAKNHRNVIPLCDPNDYKRILELLEKSGDVPLQVRRSLALKAFLRVSRYYAKIFKVLSELYAAPEWEILYMRNIGNVSNEEMFSLNDFSEDVPLEHYMDVLLAIHYLSILPEGSVVFVRGLKPIFASLTYRDVDFEGVLGYKGEFRKNVKNFVVARDIPKSVRGIRVNEFKFIDKGFMIMGGALKRELSKPSGSGDDLLACSIASHPIYKGVVAVEDGETTFCYFDNDEGEIFSKMKDLKTSKVVAFNFPINDSLLNLLKGKGVRKVHWMNEYGKWVCSKI